MIKNNFWSPEELLIIKCLSLPVRLSPAIKTSADQIDWVKFTRQTSSHGVSGLIYYHIRQRGLQYIFPDNVHRFLKTAYYRNIIQNMLTLKELRKILAALQGHGIEPLLIQGISLLISQVYASLGMRPLNDVDLLIEQTQLKPARQILHELGYRALPFYPNLFSNQKILFDIHSDIFNADRIAARRYVSAASNKSLWQAAHPLEGAWGKTRSLSLNDQIITAAAHLQKHSFSRLIWLADIMTLLHGHETGHDWSKTAARAKELNLQKPLYFTLMMIRQVFNYSPPITLTANLLDKKLSLTEKALLCGLLNGARQECVSEALDLCSINPIGKKLLYLKENIFPKPKIIKQVAGYSHPVGVGFAYITRVFQSLIYGIRLLVTFTAKLSRQA
jgi:hypothetical protein